MLEKRSPGRTGLAVKEKRGFLGALGLAPWGRRELVLAGLFSCAAGACAWGLGAGRFSAIAALPFIFTAYFFRDPERVAPGGEDEILSPADGVVVEAGAVEEDEFMAGKAYKVAVFMSLFDVHVNRAPCSGKVEMIRHHKGLFLNAMRREASERNERTLVGVTTARGCKILTKQVAGIVARRVVTLPAEGDVMSRGERIGMVKFGSRLEVYVSAEDGFEPAVRVGQRVRAGESVLGVIK